jgi:hypothetical protein
MDRETVNDLLLEAELFAETHGNKDLRDNLRYYRWSLTLDNDSAKPAKDRADDGQQDDRHGNPPATTVYAREKKQ